MLFDFVTIVGFTLAEALASFQYTRSTCRISLAS